LPCDWGKICLSHPSCPLRGKEAEREKTKRSSHREQGRHRLSRREKNKKERGRRPFYDKEPKVPFRGCKRGIETQQHPFRGEEERGDLYNSMDGGKGKDHGLRHVLTVKERNSSYTYPYSFLVSVREGRGERELLRDGKEGGE